MDFFRISQGQLITGMDFLHFNVIDLIITQGQDADQITVCFKHHGFNALLCRQIQEGPYRINRLRIRGINFFIGGIILSIGHRLRCDFGNFLVCRIITGGANGQNGFAIIGQDVKLVGIAATNLARIGQDRLKGQSTPAEDGGVGLIHILISLVQSGFIQVKGIQVFHDKFATPHQAKPWPTFIAIFILNLIQAQGQGFIRADGLAHQVGNDFFVGWAKAELALVSVSNAHQFLAVDLPATALFPQFSWLQNRHQDLLPTETVHFFTDNGLHFCQNPVA